jgi:glycerol-3-phosphate O-acyltransferase
MSNTSDTIASKKTMRPKIRIAWWLRLIQAILVRYVKVDHAWIQKVKDAAQVGPIFFVLRNRSLIDFLCLEALSRKHHLPRVSFVSGLSPFFFLPFVFWLVGKFQRSKREARLQRLKETFASGGSAVVFLRRPAVRGTLGSRPVVVDGVQLAVEAQDALGLRVQALPTVFLWGESPMKRLPGTMDFIFGSNEYPRLVRSIWLLLRRRSVHELTVSAPLDLAAIRSARHIEGRALTGVIRAGVGRQIEIIRRARLGALTKPSSRLMTEVLKSDRLKSQLMDIAEDLGMPKEEVHPKAAAILKKMAADFRPRIVGLFSIVMGIVWKRIYTGIDVRKEDIERLRRGVSNSASLLLPSHKSHMDYIVLSHLMREHNLMLPHIVAGQNLSFWPLGWLFRSSGAFFIRRSFIHDRFYTAVVSAYMRRLVQEGLAIEVFIEGGRSRTGKLLRPKTGMLDMALKAIAISPRAKLTVVPVFIGYEHVIEENAYVAESEGRPKKAENIKGLISSTKVLFSRYGRVYVRAGEPFSVEDMLEEKGLTREDLKVDSVRRTFAFALGARNLAEINALSLATSATVLSTVLLSEERPELSYEALSSRALWLVDLLERVDAPLSPILMKWRDQGTDKNSLFHRSMRVFVKNGRIQAVSHSGEKRYAIRDGQRRPLDYYKNNTIHFLAPAASVATIVLAAGGADVSLAHIRKQIRLTCRLFQSEFIIKPFLDQSPEDVCPAADPIADGALDALVKMGVLIVDDTGASVLDRESASFLANVLRNYHEIYGAVLEAVKAKSESALQDPTSQIAQRIAQARLESQQFRCPEGPSTINLRSAVNTLKELKISNPKAGEDPFAKGGLGTALHTYLEAALAIGDTGRTNTSG